MLLHRSNPKSIDWVRGESEKTGLCHELFEFTNQSIWAIPGGFFTACPRRTTRVAVKPMVVDGVAQFVECRTRDPKKHEVRTPSGTNKQWEIIALEHLTSHMTLNAGPQQQRPESPTITPPGMR